MDEMMEAAARMVRDGRRVDAVALALNAVQRFVQPDRARMEELTRTGYTATTGGPDAVTRWLASLPRPGTLGF